MKAVILAGGLGMRLSEETQNRPKPMVEVGGRPILWHILKLYSAHGINDFIVCVGYRGYVIKEYFANYFLYMSDVTFDMASNQMQVHEKHAEPWRITIVDTGETTMTGGRLRRVRQYLGDETFCLTYGDGLSDVDITRLIRHHRRSKRLATLTGVKPPGRFGAIETKGNLITRFKEKPDGDGGWINGGFFVAEPKVIDYIDGDQCVWERKPLERLAARSELSVYRHDGFWYAMDTLRDKNHLDALWNTGKAPWKNW